MHPLPQILRTRTCLPAPPPPQQHPSPAELEGRKHPHTPRGATRFWGANAGLGLSARWQCRGCCQRGRGIGNCHHPAVPGLSCSGDAAAPPERGWHGTDHPEQPVGPSDEPRPLAGRHHRARSRMGALTGAGTDAATTPPPAHHPWAGTLQRVPGEPRVQLSPLHPPRRCWPCRWALQHGEHRHGCTGVPVCVSAQRQRSDPIPVPSLPRVPCPPPVPAEVGLGFTFFLFFFFFNRSVIY